MSHNAGRPLAPIRLDYYDGINDGKKRCKTCNILVSNRAARLRSHSASHPPIPIADPPTPTSQAPAHKLHNLCHKVKFMS